MRESDPRASLGLLVILALLGRLDPKGQQARQELQDQRGRLDPKGQRARQAPLVLLARRGTRETRDRKGQLATRGHRAR
jgi:hypothetical protein